MSASPVDDSGRKAAADADKAEADARAARIAADQAEQNQKEWNTDYARRQREAEARKAIADADKAEADQKQAQITSLIPDFSKVDRGETKIEGDQTLFASVLAHQALAEAAHTLVQKILGSLPQDASEPVLITADPDLATSDASYMEVHEGIEALITAADALLQARQVIKADFAGPAAAAAVASALPSVVSLLSAHRSISSHPISADTTAATAQVASELLANKRPVRLDDFRLLPEAPILDREKELRRRRTELAREKQARDEERIQQDTLRASAQEEVDSLTTRLDALTPGTDYDRINELLRKAREQRDAAAQATKAAGVEVGLMGDILTTIDAFLISVHAVPSGGKRSPLTAAVLREALRSGEGPNRFSRVLFLASSGGSADQLFSDRPLWSKDKYDVIAGMSISYWLIDTHSSNIIASGIATGVARLTGSVGADFKIKTNSTGQA